MMVAMTTCIKLLLSECNYSTDGYGVCSSTALMMLITVTELRLVEDKCQTTNGLMAVILQQNNVLSSTGEVKS